MHKSACEIKKRVLIGVWYIPKLQRNLFSVGRFIKDVGAVRRMFYGAKDLRWMQALVKAKGFSSSA